MLALPTKRARTRRHGIVGPNGEVEGPGTQAGEATRAHNLFRRPRRTTTGASRTPPTIVRHPRKLLPMDLLHLLLSQRVNRSTHAYISQMPRRVERPKGIKICAKKDAVFPKVNKDDHRAVDATPIRVGLVATP